VSGLSATAISEDDQRALRAVNGHELVETRLCRFSSCPAEATTKATRGPWANLCDEHLQVEKERQRAKRGKARPPGSPQPPAAERSFEQRARGLVEVGRRLDRAVAKLRPARLEFEEAQKAWRSVCRQLAGDSVEREEER
jgi:hypothetical protein